VIDHDLALAKIATIDRCLARQISERFGLDH